MAEQGWGAARPGPRGGGTVDGGGRYVWPGPGGGESFGVASGAAGGGGPGRAPGQEREVGGCGGPGAGTVPVTKEGGGGESRGILRFFVQVWRRAGVTVEGGAGGY